MHTNKPVPLLLFCEHSIQSRGYVLLRGSHHQPSRAKQRSDCSQGNIIRSRKHCTYNKMLVVFPLYQVWYLTPHISKGRKNPKILAPLCCLKPAPPNVGIQVTVSICLQADVRNGDCILCVLHCRDSHIRRQVSNANERQTPSKIHLYMYSYMAVLMKYTEILHLLPYQHETTLFMTTLLFHQSKVIFPNKYPLFNRIVN